MNFFKKKTSAKDALRTSKKETTVAIRGTERQIASLQLEEKKLVAEIKKTTKTGNAAAIRTLANELEPLRQKIADLQCSLAQIIAVATRTQAMYASSSISTGLNGASKAMAEMNKVMKPTEHAKIMEEFQKQSTQMDVTQEMMSEAFDGTLDKDEAEEETEELTQVLDEIGIDIASVLSSAPEGCIAANNKKVEKAPRTIDLETVDVDDLEELLAFLRRT